MARSFLIFFLIIFSAACAGKSVDPSDPAALYREAEEEIESDHYQFAIDKLRVIRNRFPYSKYAVEAQLRIADVFYLQESYAEAALAYESFRDLYPKHEKVPYAMFRQAKSYYKDAPDNIARDLTSANKALAAYQEFLGRFPNVADAIEARNDLVEVRLMLARKELYIGNYYFKRDQFDSAKARYEKLISRFPDTQAADEARKKLETINMRTQ